MSDSTASSEQLNQSLKALNEEYDAFMKFWRNTCSNAASAALVNVVDGRRFDAHAIGRAMVGYRSVELKAHLVYGDFVPNGSAEGSLYTHFGTATTAFPYSRSLRNHWAGGALYLDGSDNAVGIAWERLEEGDRAILRPVCLNGRTILAIEEDGVRTAHPKALEKQMYDERVAAGQPVGSLKDPGDVPDVIAPHAELAKMLEDMREGLRITRALVDELLAKDAQPA